MDEPEGIGFHEADGVPYKLSYYFRKSGWKYSDALEEDINLVNAKKKYEEKSGVATPGKQSAVLRIEVAKSRLAEVEDPLAKVFD